MVIWKSSVRLKFNESILSLNHCFETICPNSTMCLVVKCACQCLSNHGGRFSWLVASRMQYQREFTTRILIKYYKQICRIFHIIFMCCVRQHITIYLTLFMKRNVSVVGPTLSPNSVSYRAGVTATVVVQNGTKTISVSARSVNETHNFICMYKGNLTCALRLYYVSQSMS